MAGGGDLAAVFSTATGRVSAFDDHAGGGEVTDGTRTWPFHCTRIADGSRTIAVGTRVTFEIVLGPTGIEASALQPCA